jgi:hypothetical protein
MRIALALGGLAGMSAGKRLQKAPPFGVNNSCLAGHFSDFAWHTARNRMADRARLFRVFPCRATDHATVQLGDFSYRHVA